MASVWVVALRMLAARRLTEMQLRDKLVRREYPADEITAVLARARELRYLDDLEYARIFIQTRAGVHGDRRVIGDLMRRGIDRELALSALTSLEGAASEEARLAQAVEKLRRTRPGISLPTLARGLERLGFPAAAIYRFLQNDADALFSGREGAQGE